MYTILKAARRTLVATLLHMITQGKNYRDTIMAVLFRQVCCDKIFNINFALLYNDVNFLSLIFYVLLKNPALVNSFVKILLEQSAFMIIKSVTVLRTAEIPQMNLNVVCNVCNLNITYQLMKILVEAFIYTICMWKLLLSIFLYNNIRIGTY